MSEDEIREIMAEETSRGRWRPRTAASTRAKAERRRTVRELLAIRDRNEFVAAIIEYGLQPGSSEFEQALKAWREYGDT